MNDGVADGPDEQLGELGHIGDPHGCRRHARVARPVREHDDAVPFMPRCAAGTRRRRACAGRTPDGGSPATTRSCGKRRFHDGQCQQAAAATDQPRRMRPRSAAKHIDMLTAPTAAIAIAAWRSSPHSHPSTSERAQPFEEIGDRVPAGHGVEPAGELIARHVRGRQEQEREEQQEARVDRPGVAGLERDRIPEPRERQAPQRSEER